MKTRHAAEGSPFHQERYASSPALEKGLNGVLVKNRCATLSDPREIEMVWFIQYQSMQRGGLEKFAADLLADFSERLGTPAMLKIGKQDGVYNAAESRSVCREAYRFFDCSPFLEGESKDVPSSYPVASFLEMCRAKFIETVPGLLTQFCLDPALSVDQLQVISEDVYRVPVFHDFYGALLEYMERWEKKHLAKIGMTKVARVVLDAMEYAEAERALVLIEGVYGTGKTFPSRAWCEARPGKRRYVQCPSSNDSLDFFRTMAEPLGVSNAHSMKGQQMRARINDVAQAGHLSIVIDESHYLFPQASTRVALPGRINWVMTALTNYNVPVVMVATPQFMSSRATVERNTFWAAGQLDGRISRYVPLPKELEESDLRTIAGMHLPRGDEKSITALALYAQASKKRLRGIEHGVKAARHVARRAGRDQVTFADIKQAMKENVMPSDSALNIALSHAARPTGAGRKLRHGKIYTAPPQEPLETISAPVPERDCGTALIVTPDRKNKRFGQASLSQT
jgi:hypothetical protein